jgi:ABC-type branched-subunit amino acid transport system ATPase component
MAEHQHLIEAKGLAAGYGAGAVIRDLDLYVDAGEVVAILGPNGAGKSTTLRVLGGVISPLSGEVYWNGGSVRTPLYKRCRQGLSYVTEERCIFSQLTTRQNLHVAGVDPNEAEELFPELRGRLGLKAGQMSGGEQQMLALARALGRKPRLLLADELSIGLAPLVVERLMNAVRTAADAGLGVLLVEQFAAGAMRIADRVYVIRNGQVVLSGHSDEFRRDSKRLEAAYLGNDP